MIVLENRTGTVETGKTHMGILGHRDGFLGVFSLDHTGRFLPALNKYLEGLAPVKGLDRSTTDLIQHDRAEVIGFVCPHASRLHPDQDTSNPRLERKIIGLKRVPAGVAINGSEYLEGGKKFFLLGDAPAVLFRIELAVMLRDNLGIASQLGLEGTLEEEGFMRSKSGGVRAWFESVRLPEGGQIENCQILRLQTVSGAFAQGRTRQTTTPSLVLVDLTGQENTAEHQAK
jgi:hypothetical protein